ncbi:MAG TPA: nitrogen fixation protein NifX [Anaeromyxobacter sp.]
MKVAFTSSDGKTIDQHFGMAAEYCIWEIGLDTAEPVTRVSPLITEGDEEDRTSARANAVAGCAIVYTVQIGGPAAAKLVARKIHPMKTGAELPIAEAVAKLQQVLKGTPPPWLRKAMGGDGASRDFEEA